MALANPNNGAVIVGHSWASRLRKSGLLDDGFSKFIDLPGGTFPRLTALLEKEEACQHKYDYVFVFLGGNDVDNAWGIGEVNRVMDDCNKFLDQLRVVFPSAKLVVSQIEERFLSQADEADEFRRKGNKFNKWLNKNPRKDKIFMLRGGQNFGIPIWYLDDGVHLNQGGMVKLAAQVSGYFEDRRAHQ